MSDFHPTWALRRLRNRVSAAWREWRTGVPGWIVEIGEITACPHGYTLVSDWSLNPYVTDWEGPLEKDELVDRLVLAVPDCVTHGPLPDQCTFCNHAEEMA